MKNNFEDYFRQYYKDCVNACVDAKSIGNIKDNHRTDSSPIPNNLIYAEHRQPQWKPYKMTESDKKQCPDKNYKWDVTEFFTGV